MAHIAIHNETDYTLTDDMTQQIIRDAQEHFGEEVRAIRVQSGLERHALNARTWEVRYAFSPQDFGLSHPMPTVQEPSAAVAVFLTRDEETEDTLLPVPFADVADVAEDLRRTRSPSKRRWKASMKGRTTRRTTSSNWMHQRRILTRTMRTMSWMTKRMRNGSSLRGRDLGGAASLQGYRVSRFPSGMHTTPEEAGHTTHVQRQGLHQCL